MSHKTGKRVLTASTSLALAVVGLAASPIAAHATPSVSLVNVCGGDATSSFDYVELPAKSGTYQILDGTSGAPTAANTDTASSSTTVAAGASVLSADGLTVRYYLNGTAYGSADAAGVKHLLGSVAVYDSLGTKLTPSLPNGEVTDATCSISSVPPVTSNVTTHKITVTKGVGITWNVAIANGAAVGNTTVTASTGFVAGTNVANTGGGTNNTLSNVASAGPAAANLRWNASDGPTATQVLTVAGPVGTEVVTVKATAAAGYTGVDVVQTFKMDNKTQVTYVSPKVVDLDGTTSDGAQVTPITGVTWYYSTDPAAVLTDFGADGSGNYVASTHGWTAMDTSSGQTVIPRGTLTNTQYLQVAAATNANYKFGNTGAAINASTGDNVRGSVNAIQFTDTTQVTSIPAPTFTDGPGSEDYYTLPSVPGVKWLITGDPAYSGTRTVLPTEVGLLNTPLRVIQTTSSNNPFTVSITAAPSDAAVYTIKSGVPTGPWTHEFDSRNAIAPAGPQFIDMTGLADDTVSFPNLGGGITKYQYGLGAKTDGSPTVDLDPITGGTQAWKDLDGSWYGKTASVLADLKATSPNTKVFVQAVLADGSVIAKAADGTDVPKMWSYFFDNLVNIVPQAPVASDAAGTANDTITFPVDTRVTYTMIQNGISRVIPASDLGKPLPASGKVVVKVAAAPGYAIQTDASGKLPADWTYTFSAFDPIKPQAPSMVNNPGLDNDTFTLPAQQGIVWNVNGKDVPLSAYGSPISTGGVDKITVVAQAGDGYTLDSTAQYKWLLDYSVTIPTNVQIGNTKDTGASVPTTVFHWSADNATSYDVTYHKTLLNGSAGPEIDWMMDTTATEANFVAEPGDEYTVTVVAKNDNGDADAVSSTVKFDGGSAIGDVTSGQGTFSAGWNLLGKAQLSGLPYYGDTAALASNGATWTYTVPAGTKSFDLFATVHSLGAKGKIWVNGVNWADFETNPSYWGTVSNPYGYPVRRVQGWDNTKSATITVQQTEGGNLYLALDAYRVNK